MAIAETAELAVLLKLKDELSAPLAQTNARIKELESTSTSATTRGLGGLEKGLNNVGGALSHAKSQLGGLLTGPLGFLGLTAGVLSVGAAMEKGISKAQDWGLAIEKMQGITKDSAESLSGLLAVTEKFGISTERFSMITGFAEKALGNITKTGDGAKKFFDAYGFSVVDAQGKTKDFATELLTFSDYWNKNKDAGLAAAAAAKLFGRGYADLVPVLNLGSKGIQDAIDEAKALGLTLTQDNVEALAKAREATREWGDALSGLELQIGLDLLPAVTDLAKAATSFVRDNRQGILQFFRDAAHFAGEFGGAIKDDVLPVFSGIKAAWDTLPEPLKKLLITGFIARGTVKWLFGVDIAKPITEGLAGLLKGAAGSLFQRGGSPANPVFVSDVTGGKGGIPPITAGGAGLALTAAGAFAAIVASPIYLSWFARTFNPTNDPNNPAGRTFDPGATNVGGLPPGIHTGSRTPPMPGFGANTVRIDPRDMDKLTQGAVGATRDMDKNLPDNAAVARAVLGLTDTMKRPPWMDRLIAAWNEQTKAMHEQVDVARKNIAEGRNVAKSAALIAEHPGGFARAKTEIGELKAALANTHDPKAQAAITAALRALEHKLPSLAERHALLDKAEKIAQSSESRGHKLDELRHELHHVDSPSLKGKIQDMIGEIKKQPTHLEKMIQQAKSIDAQGKATNNLDVLKGDIKHLKQLRDDFNSKGDTHSARKVTQDISDLKARLASKQDEAKRAITTAEHQAQAAIVAAIRSSQSLVQVILNVSSGSVTRSTTTQRRIGDSGGSASRGGMAHAPGNGA